MQQTRIYRPSKKKLADKNKYKFSPKDLWNDEQPGSVIPDFMPYFFSVDDDFISVFKFVAEGKYSNPNLAFYEFESLKGNDDYLLVCSNSRMFSDKVIDQITPRMRNDIICNGLIKGVSKNMFYALITDYKQTKNSHYQSHRKREYSYEEIQRRRQEEKEKRDNYNYNRKSSSNGNGNGNGNTKPSSNTLGNRMTIKKEKPRPARVKEAIVKIGALTYLETLSKELTELEEESKLALLELNNEKKHKKDGKKKSNEIRVIDEKIRTKKKDIQRLGWEMGKKALSSEASDLVGLKPVIETKKPIDRKEVEIKEARDQRQRLRDNNKKAREDTTGSGFSKRWHAFEPSPESDQHRPVGYYIRDSNNPQRMFNDGVLSAFNSWFKFNGCPWLTLDIKFQLQDKFGAGNFNEYDLSYTNAMAIVKDIQLLLRHSYLKDSIAPIEVMPKHGSVTLALMELNSTAKVPLFVLPKSSGEKDEEMRIFREDLILATRGLYAENCIRVLGDMTLASYNLIYINLSLPRTPVKDVIGILKKDGITATNKNIDEILLNIISEGKTEDSIRLKYEKIHRERIYTRDQWTRLEKYIDLVKHNVSSKSFDPRGGAGAKKILCFPVPRFRVSPPNKGYRNVKDSSEVVINDVEQIVDYKEDTMEKDLDPLMDIMSRHGAPLYTVVGIFGGFYLVYIIAFRGEHFQDFHEYLKTTLGSKCFHRRYFFIKPEESSYKFHAL
jgi:hypothetical protein